MMAIDRLIPLFSSDTEESQPVETQLAVLKCQNLTLIRGDQTIFSGLNAEFLPGERVVIQGASGSGKSSLLMVLSGALRPAQGGWFINDHPVDAMDDKNRSQYIAVVDQQSKFFAGTLRSNLLLAKPLCEESLLWQLLDGVGLGELVRTLPNQLDTDIGETRRLFSGGEMQRLSIVRAALAKTPVLILDEVTAHLDPVSEQKVLSALRTYAPEQIQLIISHRVQAVKQADRHLVLKAGELQEISHG
ncbi:ATP-binding cassette domain-containing protein [Vibrio sonorensis]|uniref:ATP-binding cassette domain-containing protein n=1 Tax=Vibrio sonorensis TaxID=1004316 RepID=UPI00316AD949